MELQILVDGQPAVTTSQAADARGITLAGMRAVLKQNGIQPVMRLDGRTPLYDEATLNRELPPPGRGAHWRRSTNRSADPITR